MVRIIGWLDTNNVVGVSALVVGVCSFSSLEDVSSWIIASIFNNKIVTISLILIVGENKPNLKYIPAK